MPHREVVDGVLVIFGGAFLITPGFITDIVGLTLLVPPTRAVVRRCPDPPARPARRRWRASPADYDVEGTAREYDDPPQPRLER